MIVIGVDPGLSGALAVVSAEGNLVAFDVMPCVGNVVDASGVVRLLRDYVKGHADVRVYLERGQAMRRPGRGQGASSAFKFGRVCGLMEGALAGLGLSYMLVPPQSWQKVMHAGIERSLDPKERSRIAALRRFPGSDLRASPRCKKAHDGIVDAALIAAWGQGR